MTQLKVEDRSVVVPGEVLAYGIDYLPSLGTYRFGDQILASRLGIVKIEGKVLKLIPLSGRYLPKEHDMIIGKVIDVNMMGWRLDTNSAYSALLSMKDGSSDFIRKGADLTRYYDVGDYVVTRITQVTSQRLIDLTMKGPGLYKLVGGRLITVNPSKVPRIIGKQGSMVSMIKKVTDCNIIVGQNGRVWIKGKPASVTLTVKTIRKIERESHVSGLTDKIKEYLDGETDGLQKKN